MEEGNSMPNGSAACKSWLICWRHEPGEKEVEYFGKPHAPIKIIGAGIAIELGWFVYVKVTFGCMIG